MATQDALGGTLAFLLHSPVAIRVLSNTWDSVDHEPRSLSAWQFPRHMISACTATTPILIPCTRKCERQERSVGPGDEIIPTPDILASFPYHVLGDLVS